MKVLQPQLQHKPFVAAVKSHVIAGEAVETGAPHTCSAPAATPATICPWQSTGSVRTFWSSATHFFKMTSSFEDATKRTFHSFRWFPTHLLLFIQRLTLFFFT